MNIGPRYPCNINVVLYGVVTRAEWASAFVTLATKVQQQLGLSYSSFGCAYLEPAHVSSTVKSLRYIKRNASRIDALLARPDLYAVDFDAVDAGADVVRDARCIVSMSLPYPDVRVAAPYSRIALHVVPDVAAPAVRQCGPMGLLACLVRAAMEVMDIAYALAEPLSSPKVGGIYFGMDTYTGGLGQRERDDLRIWLRCRKDYATKVRGVYWANFMTCQHLGAEPSRLLGEIEQEVGEANVAEVLPGMHLVVLPVDILGFPGNAAELDSQRGRLGEILLRHDLLMA